jgi:predicted membrane-bound spermidine synthase
MTDWQDFQVDVPEGTSGEWSVRRFIVGSRGRAVAYTGLYHHGSLVMSDSPDEIYDRWRVLTGAGSPSGRPYGNILIAGLGLGVVLQGVARCPEVTRITVIEQARDVIELAWNRHWRQADWSAKVRVVHESIFKWHPPKYDRYQMAWFDIWSSLSLSNLEEIATLHRRFARRCDWYGSWGHRLLRREKASRRRVG